MIAARLASLVVNEARLRTRRIGTVVIFLAVVVLSWMMVPDPRSGMTMMAINEARVVYDSQSLGLAGSLLVDVVVSLAGFYLVRGRMRGDINLGTGAVIASTAIGDGALIFSRWLGAVAYLSALSAAFLLSFLVLQKLRGEGPLLLTVYLLDFAAFLMPTMLLVSSLALLFESWTPLLGKRGDVLYFFVWLTMIGIGGTAGSHPASSFTPGILLDSSGLGLATFGLHRLIHTTAFSIGIASFDASVGPVHLPAGFWSAPMLQARAITAAIATLPLLLALSVFHRFSPDKVRRAKVASPSFARLPLNRLEALFQPALRRLFTLAMRLPGSMAGVLAEVSVILASSMLALPALFLSLLAGCLVEQRYLGACLFAIIAVFAIGVSDAGVRATENGLDAMLDAVPGGAAARYSRQLLATALLGVVASEPVLLRWLSSDGTRAAALLSGLSLLVGTAAILGCLTRTARTFIAISLFGLYVSSQARGTPALDFVGANGSATVSSIALTMLAATSLIAVGFAANAWMTRRPG